MIVAGVDCGTQSTKVLLLDSDTGGVLGVGQSAHELIENGRGGMEQHPDGWIDALKIAFAEALASSGVFADAIGAIGVSGQQHGCVVLDASDQVIRPAKLWCDTETSDACAELIAALGGQSAVIDILGTALAVGYTASKVAWLKKHEPDNYARVAKIMLPHDYINYWLTGEFSAEAGDSSGTGYFDIRSRSWSEKVLAAIDPDADWSSRLGKLLPSDAIVGALRAEAAQALGLRPQVQVSSGSGDNMMGAIGSGNVQPGVVSVSLGTSGTVYAFAESAAVDSSGEVAGFCDATGHWLPLACTMNVTGVLHTFAAGFGLNPVSLAEAAALAPVGAGGLTLLPFLAGERTPSLPEASGSLLGVRSHNFDAAHVARASYEGVSFGMRYALERLGSMGLSASELRLSGGGANNAFWRQLLADTCHTEVVCQQNHESAALGAALQAAWACGKESLASLCQRTVQLDESTRVAPQTFDALEQAWQRYSQHLQHLHGI